MNRKRLLLRLLHGHHLNVKFNDFINLVEGFGFELFHQKGSHRAYFHPEIEDGLNLQPRRGEAKDYQIKQFLILIERYKLKLEQEE